MGGIFAFKVKNKQLFSYGDTRYNEKNNHVIFEYKIWNIFEKKYNMTFYETKIFLKKCLIKHFPELSDIDEVGYFIITLEFEEVTKDAIVHKKSLF